ncbi:hypothetical protein [Microbacterium arborescens]|uniref:hypothetical protein n=1 Tax=Microbacterium arborescens TaxID=33883 RepID=UPI000DF748ED|nr:hypothetical protein [Microbacterium arborescens]
MVLAGVAFVTSLLVVRRYAGKQASPTALETREVVLEATPPETLHEIDRLYYRGKISAEERVARRAELLAASANTDH